VLDHVLELGLVELAVGDVAEHGDPQRSVLGVLEAR